MPTYTVIVPPKDIRELNKAEVWKKYMTAYEQAAIDDQAAYEAACALRKDLIREAAVLYGKNHRVVQYLSDNRTGAIPKPPNHADAWNRLLGQWRKWNKKEEQRIEAERALERVRHQRRDYAERVDMAIADLEAAGYIAGVDFVTGRAITTRKQLLIEIRPGEWMRRSDMPGPEDEPMPEVD